MVNKPKKVTLCMNLLRCSVLKCLTVKATIVYMLDIMIYKSKANERKGKTSISLKTCSIRGELFNNSSDPCFRCNNTVVSSCATLGH